MPKNLEVVVGHNGVAVRSRCTSNTNTMHANDQEHMAPDLIAHSGSTDNTGNPHHDVLFSLASGIKDDYHASAAVWFVILPVHVAKRKALIL